MPVLTLPDLGEGLQQAEIVSWHVAVGDHIVTNQPLLAVETDKAVVEIPAPAAGTVERLCAAVGDRLQVGAPLVEYSGKERPDSGTVVGNLNTALEPSVASPINSKPDQHRAAPAVRVLARRLHVDLSGITGSGPGGAILSGDVEQAVSGKDSPASVEAMRGVRRAMAERMAVAHAQVVPATVYADADIHSWPSGTDVLLRLVQAIASACLAEPALNVWLEVEPMQRRIHRQIDLGIAVDTADGLFVPTLRDVGGRDASNLSEGIARLKQDVLARSIPAEALRGQTITLSNFGSIGGRYAALVVVPPQVAIVGAGQIRDAVMVVDDKPAVRRQLPLSLSFDHRAVTGGEATRFMAAMIADLQQSSHNAEPPDD